MSGISAPWSLGQEQLLSESWFGLVEARPSQGPLVDLVVPAEAAYLALVRTSAAGLAARWSFSLEDLEDLRLAVAEACALVLTAAATGTRLHCRFRGGHGKLWFAVAAMTDPLRILDHEHFGWAILGALTQDVQTLEPQPGVILVGFRKTAGTTVAA